jgi:DNA polymerase IIIc chi subunit
MRVDFYLLDDPASSAAAGPRAKQAGERVLVRIRKMPSRLRIDKALWEMAPDAFLAWNCGQGMMERQPLALHEIAPQHDAIRYSGGRQMAR